MPASHFDVNSMTGRPKFIVRHSTNVLYVNCQTQGRLKLMIELYMTEICHKFQ
jgi:hypothetical protein